MRATRAGRAMLWLMVEKYPLPGAVRYPAAMQSDTKGPAADALVSNGPDDEALCGRLAGGVLVGAFDGTELPDETAARLRAGHLAGVTLFKRNVRDASQVMRLCAAMLDASPAGEPPVIAIDQEGGRVARLRQSVPQLPAMRVLGSLDDTSVTRSALRALGTALAAIGINLDFAPVADVDSNPKNPVIGDRSFGADPSLVARHVTAAIEGFREAGIHACAKHFPGHGDTAQDSHLELPRLEHDRARLDAIELIPFRAAVSARVASVMTAHVVFAPLTGDEPATFVSDTIEGLLRKELGFEGVVISDDLLMRAVADRYPVDECAVRALRAGCDMVLVCDDPAAQEKARVGLAREAQRDPVFRARLRQAYDRVLALRTSAPPRPLRDEAALAALLERTESDPALATIRAHKERTA